MATSRGARNPRTQARCSGSARPPPEYEAPLVGAGNPPPPPNSGKRPLQALSAGCRRELDAMRRRLRNDCGSAAQCGALIQELHRIYTTRDIPMERLAPAVGRSPAWICNAFARARLPARPPHKRTRFAPPPRRTHALQREDAFDTIATPAQAYWYGFLWADGYCMLNGGLRVVLHPDDRETLAHLKAFLGAMAPIKERTAVLDGKRHPQVELAIWSQRLARGVERLGLVAHRSERGLRPVALGSDLRPHFYRGLFEGDGAITRIARARFPLAGWSMQFAGSAVVCEEFLRYISAAVQDELPGYVAPNHHRNGLHERNRAFCLQGPAAIASLSLLYRDAPTAMRRNRAVVELLTSAYNEVRGRGVQIDTRGDGWRFAHTDRVPAELGRRLREAILATGHPSAKHWFRPPAVSI
jgi:hypothetical protein